MKQILFSLMLAVVAAVAPAAEATSIDYLKQMRVALSIYNPEELSTLLDNTRNAVISGRNNDLAARWATLKTLNAGNIDASLTFSGLHQLLLENCAAVGAKGEVDITYGGFLINPNYAKNVTAGKVAEAVEFFRDKKAGFAFCEALILNGRKEQALALLKDMSGYSAQHLYLSTVWREAPDKACDAFMNYAYSGVIDSRIAREFVNRVLERILVRSDLDRAAFKKKLQTISLMYNNRMTSGGRRAEWGTFVSIVQNTVEKL